LEAQSVANIAVHAMAMIVVIRAARSAAAKWLSFPSLRLGTVMIATIAVLMAAHMCELAIWSVAYAFVEGAEWLYFAFVNYTTLTDATVVVAAIFSGFVGANCKIQIAFHEIFPSGGVGVMSLHAHASRL
jgi:hypothetical protein